MEILGIGASEFVFIILIAIIILGPKDMEKAGRTIGRWLNQLVRSDGWKIFQRTSNEIRNLPRNLMREANMDLQDIDKELRRTIDPRQTSSASSSLSDRNPAGKPDTNPPSPNITENPTTDEAPTVQPTGTDSDEHD